MTKLPFMQFFPDLWLRDTRKLSPVAKAVWIDIVAYCWNEPERGIYRRTKAAMAREHSLTVDEIEDVLSELSLSGVADISDHGESVAVLSRRILKEEKVREYERIRKRHQRCPGGVPDLSLESPPGCPGSVPQETLEVRSQKSEVTKEKREKESGPANGADPHKLAKPKHRKKALEFWQPMVDHINQAWLKRKGTAYPWDPHEFKKLHGLATNYQAWGMMAMWDLYFEKATYWGKLTGYMLDGLKKDIGIIVDDQRWKTLSKEYEQRLFSKPEDQLVPTQNVLAQLVSSVKSIP